MFGNKNGQAPEYINPVMHDGVSATATTVANASGKGLLTGLKGAGGMFLAGILLAGAGVGFGLAALGVGVVGASVAGVAGAILAGPAVGTVLGIAGGVVGSIVGAITGAKHGIQKVDVERTAALQVQNELAAGAMQAQAMSAQAQAIGYQHAANSYAAGLPPQGSPMNQASPQINAADIAEHSRLADLELQRA